MTSLNLSIEPVTPMTGTEFASQLVLLDRFKREPVIEQALLTGNVPAHMREFKALDIKFGQSTLTIHVLPDYLMVGTDADHIRVPMFPMTAQRIANAWNCILPTTLLVDKIWKAAKKIDPQPWGEPYDSSMMSSSRIPVQNSKVEAQIKKKGYVVGDLLAGHSKDIVISTKMVEAPDRVGIYGWHQANGVPIQNLNFHSHELTYADYSHAVRLISCGCIVDGQPFDLRDILRNHTLCSAASSEGPLTCVEYPLTA